MTMLIVTQLFLKLSQTSPLFSFSPIGSSSNLGNFVEYSYGKNRGHWGELDKKKS